ncbi:hypothetical protein [Priestia taiwanensis]|uniref:Uncharacterized protein n=1 Tax=Priestia taiwanensis TaxID=1347902 RepID=A0A917AKI9_9BACI|nr:hypothetical protein [Priestia taiwanensis]MBM7361921.1 hypothetical protein [Priestia taiwanensis]GGE58021.1 hypothetical protein GCM10007140_05480 [Priestia taiwanensis]
MVKKGFITCLLFVAMFMLCVSYVYANSSGVTAQGEAWGYEYTATEINDTSTWKIGHKGDTYTIEETKERAPFLIDFMNAVERVDSQQSRLGLFGAYLLVTVIVALILYRKNKPMFKKAIGIFSVLAGVALYFIVMTSLDLNTALEDAHFYFEKLKNM